MPPPSSLPTPGLLLVEAAKAPRLHRHAVDVLLDIHTSVPKLECLCLVPVRIDLYALGFKIGVSHWDRHPFENAVGLCVWRAVWGWEPTFPCR